MLFVEWLGEGFEDLDVVDEVVYDDGVIWIDDLGFYDGVVKYDWVVVLEGKCFVWLG